ncbi:hypothetical protein BN946_scf184828.g8 [Trametes cinnabarina]|uniref:DUF6532 domain-containing protein n=1 Tax=Pycnoporus cinnabarinus TaxID=5643 RepID=A0A060SQE3_PYCCI|nr:hypothetical protein BN946_scf184828.g8 [Trametes cinnabarina]
MSQAQSQLDNLRGPYRHSIPQIPTAVANQPVPSLADTQVISAWTVQPSLHHRPTLSGESAYQDRPVVVKRRSDQALTDEEDQREEERRRKRAELNAKRPRYKQYKSNAELYKIMRKTAELLQVMFSTENPFPDDVQEERIIHTAFNRALEIYGYGKDWYILTDNDIKLFKHEDTSIRSRVRKQAVMRVPDAYGLAKNPQSDQVAHNKKRAQFLLADSRFHYENALLNQDVDAKAGRFQHRLIREIIEEVWFGHANALGCLYQQYFKPIPHATIALVLTAIRHALTMYSDTGRRSNKDFTAASFTVYDDYMDALEQFNAGELGMLWLQHRRRMFNHALAYAGVQEEQIKEPVIALATEDELNRERARLRAQLDRDQNDDMSIASSSSDDGETYPHPVQRSTSSGQSDIPSSASQDQEIHGHQSRSPSIGAACASPHSPTGDSQPHDDHSNIPESQPSGPLEATEP